MPSFWNSKDPTGIVGGYAPAVPAPPQPEDTELASNLNNLFAIARESKLYYERRWSLNYMFLKGEHFLFRDPITGSVVVAKDKRVQNSVNNMLRPAARALVGKLCARVPKFKAIPATNQQEEVFGSRVADVFFEYFFQKEALDVKYVKLMEYLPWAGTAVAHLYWDPTAGCEKAYCEQCNYASDDVMLVDKECPLCKNAYEQLIQQAAQVASVQGELAGELGAPPPPPTEGPDVPPPPKMMRITDGDAKVRVIDPRDVYVDPTVYEPEDLRYVFIRRNVPVTEVRRRFPITGVAVSSGVDSKAYTDADTVSSGARTITDLVTLYEYHEAPTFEHPDGQIIYMAKNIILERRPGYYRKFGRLPFFWQFWTKNAREFWAEAPVTQAWSRQRELNDLESGIHSTIELTSFPALFNPVFSGLAIDKFSGAPGAVYNYNAPHKPEFAQPPTLPQQVFQRRPDLMEDIRQQFALTDQDVGVGQTDPNARAAAILSAESGRQLLPVNIRNYEEIKQLYKCLLIMARDFYDQDRKFSVAGEEWMSVYSFNDLRLSKSTDLTLEIEDGLSENQAIREQQVFNWVSTGVLNDPTTGMPNPKYVAKLAKIKLPNASGAGNDSEYASAQMRIQQALEGDFNALQPQPIDDYPIFAGVFLSWLRSNRNYKDQMVYQFIFQAWQMYHMIAMQQQMGMPVKMPGQGSSQGGSQTAPGGTPNAQMPQEDDPRQPGNDIAQQAGQIQQGADQAGEMAARQQGG